MSGDTQLLVDGERFSYRCDRCGCNVFHCIEDDLFHVCVVKRYLVDVP